MRLKSLKTQFLKNILPLMLIFIWFNDKNRTRNTRVVKIIPLNAETVKKKDFAQNAFELE